MFNPNYTITNKLLSNIKYITLLVEELNNQRFPKLVLMDFERKAREVSVFASTSIEGNPLPLTEVKKVLKNKPEYIRDSEREVLNYNEALKYLNELSKKDDLKISLDLILTVHEKVIDGLLPDFESGVFRKKHVVVNDSKSGKIVFLPPDHEDVEKLTDELVNFIIKNKNTVDSLILAGIFHKQMVIIHPFMDGNGRTTRLITKVLLARMGLDTFNLFSFENYYNKNVTKYFQTVGEYGDYNELREKIDFTNWLEYFTEGIIDELLRVKKILPQLGYSPETKIEKYHEKLFDFIKQNGFITDRDYSKLTDRAKATRTLDFQKLIEMGLIKREGKGRSTYYVLSNR
ncbi:MAG: Fic family protein [Microgenomates group bacterium]